MAARQELHKIYQNIFGESRKNTDSKVSLLSLYHLHTLYIIYDIRHVSGKVLPMDEYDPLELINEQSVLFVCATAGQGVSNVWSILLKNIFK